MWMSQAQVHTCTCEQQWGLTSSIPIPAALTLPQPQCCQISCFCSQLRCADSQPPFHSSIQQLHFLMLLQPNFSLPCPQLREETLQKIVHQIRDFLPQRKMRKNQCLPQLLSFTILISWNKSTKTLQVYCFLHEVWTVNICIYFAAKPVFLVTECEY